MNEHDLNIEALRVIRGDYGNGAVRVANLESQGLDAERIQSRVNEMSKELERNPHAYDDLIKERDTTFPLESSRVATGEAQVKQPTKGEEFVQSRQKEAEPGSKAKERPGEKDKESVESQQDEPGKKENRFLKKRKEKEQSINRDEIADDIDKWIKDNEAIRDGGKVEGLDITQKQAESNITEANKALADLKNKTADITKDGDSPLRATLDKMGKNLSDYDQKAENTAKRDENALENTKSETADKVIDASKDPLSNAKEVRDEMMNATKEALNISTDEVKGIFADTKLLKDDDLQNALEQPMDQLSEKVNDLIGQVKESLGVLVDKGQLSEEGANKIFEQLSPMKDMLKEQSEIEKTWMSGYSQAYKEFGNILKEMNGQMPKSEKHKDKVKHIKDLSGQAKDFAKKKCQASVKKLKTSSNLVKVGTVNALENMKEELALMPKKIDAAIDTKLAVREFNKVFQKKNAAAAIQIGHTKLAHDTVVKDIDILEKKLKYIIAKEDALPKISPIRTLFTKAQHKATSTKLKSLRNAEKDLSDRFNAQTRWFSKELNGQLYSLEFVKSERDMLDMKENKKLNNAIDQTKNLINQVGAMDISR